MSLKKTEVCVQETGVNLFLLATLDVGDWFQFQTHIMIKLDDSESGSDVECYSLTDRLVLVLQKNSAVYPLPKVQITFPGEG